LPEELDAAAGKVAEADDALIQLRNRVLDLGHLALGELETDLRRGSVTQRNNAIKLVAPFLLRSLEARDDDAQLEAMKIAFTSLMEPVMGGADMPTKVTGHEPGEVSTDAQADLPS